ncbi:MAG: hypothetical protein HUN04_14735 [Desulfobacter sp.]|nr:MAG: hypothetical protein HUN04_14735 [Desulfobacter sp.]
MKFFSTVLDKLSSLSGIEIQTSVFWIILMGMGCITLIIVVGKIQGEKPIISEVIDFFKDLLSYTYGEKDGKLFQKMNFGLFTILGVASLAFLGLFFWACLKKTELMEISIIGMITFFLVLCVMTPLCMKFTRHFG